MYLDTLEAILSPHSIHRSTSSFVFRVVLERKSERRRVQGYWVGFAIERFKCEFWLSISFLSLLFSQLSSMFCNF